MLFQNKLTHLVPYSHVVWSLRCIIKNDLHISPVCAINDPSHHMQAVLKSHARPICYAGVLSFWSHDGYIRRDQLFAPRQS